MALPDQQPLPFPKSQKRQAPDPRRVIKLLLTPEEAADALSIGRSKLYELIRLFGNERGVGVHGIQQGPCQSDGVSKPIRWEDPCGDEPYPYV